MLADPLGVNPLTRRIIGCAIRVHREIGPGVFESVYGQCLEYELRQAGLAYEVGRAVPVVYRGATLRARFYIDIVVENLIVVELKSVAALAEIHTCQILTQLKLTGLPVGLLINFNVKLLKDGGIRRILNPRVSSAQQAGE